MLRKTGPANQAMKQYAHDIWPKVAQLVKEEIEKLDEDMRKARNVLGGAARHGAVNHGRIIESDDDKPCPSLTQTLMDVYRSSTEDAEENIKSETE